MTATWLSGYRLMLIFVMFDLPVTTKADARAATKFREFLLDEGFEKSQFFVYARFCNGKEQFETYMRRIEAHLPHTGEIHILSLTDRQYENIVRFSGQSRRPRKNPDQLAAPPTSPLRPCHHRHLGHAVQLRVPLRTTYERSIKPEQPRARRPKPQGYDISRYTPG